MTPDEVRQLINDRAEQITQDIVAAWRRAALDELWLSLPPAMTFDDLPNVLRAIGNAALTPRFLEQDCRDIIRFSAIHGDHRSQEGFQEHFLHTEYHLLRRSLWDFLRERLDPATAVSIITRADGAITLATQAGLRGFHCRTFEARGDWPAALDRLLVEWPLVGE